MAKKYLHFQLSSGYSSRLLMSALLYDPILPFSLYYLTNVNVFLKLMSSNLPLPRHLGYMTVKNGTFTAGKIAPHLEFSLGSQLFPRNKVEASFSFK